MKAIFGGEDEGGVGLRIIDNNGVSHGISVDFDGEITYHEQNGYPDDPDERTEAGNEHVNQARRFARYWVYRKRGYETLGPQSNPDRIVLAVLALMPLTNEAANRYFGDLYDHLQSIYNETESPLEMPENVSPGEAVYQQNIYLGLDDETASSYADILSEPDVLDLLDRGASPDGELPDSLDAQTLVDAASVDIEAVTGIEDGALIEAISDVHIHWDDVLGEYHTQWGNQPLDREPDACIEIFAYEPDSITDLKKQIARHLLCQVRDCYLSMGIAPPEQFRLLGHGRHDASTWYNHYEFYDDYFDTNADISTWYEESTPENAYNTTTETEEPIQTNN